MALCESWLACVGSWVKGVPECPSYPGVEGTAAMCFTQVQWGMRAPTVLDPVHT